MLSVAILAGGRSTRMGQDKALMPFAGQPLIERVVQRLQPLSDDLFVMTSRTEELAFLKVPIYCDSYPGQGSLVGLISSMERARHALLAIVACDMPFVSRRLFDYQCERMLSVAADVVIPSSASGLEPLHAVYRCATCLPAMQQAFASGEKKIIAWFPRVQVHVLTTEETALYDPQGLAFWNLNTQQEFDSAQTRAIQDESL